jgi:hypothetical protein
VVVLEAVLVEEEEGVVLVVVRVVAGALELEAV